MSGLDSFIEENTISTSNSDIISLLKNTIEDVITTLPAIVQQMVIRPGSPLICTCGRLKINYSKRKYPVIIEKRKIIRVKKSGQNWLSWKNKITIPTHLAKQIICKTCKRRHFTIVSAIESNSSPLKKLLLMQKRDIN